jgi:hypothetical protein
MTNRPSYALSLQEPWWWAILHAGKDVENRRWPFPWGVSLPERIIVHTSKTVDESGLVFLHESPEVKRLCLIPPTPSSLRLGALVGEVTVTRCVSLAEVRETDLYSERLLRNPWAFGPWCWTLENPVEYAEPIPYVGRLGLFKVESR